MWKDYVFEREGVEVLEHEHGFSLVKQVGDALYLQDVYVVPEFRRQGVGRSMLEIVEVVAAERGLKKVITSCDPKANDSTESMKAILACGFRMHTCENNLVYLIKEI